MHSTLLVHVRFTVNAKEKLHPVRVYSFAHKNYIVDRPGKETLPSSARG